MSATNEYWEYHLTPNGWVLGDEKTDFNSKSRETPTDRVASYTYSEYQSSSFSPMEIGWECNFEDKAKTDLLMKRFGRFPHEGIKKRVLRR